MRNLFAGKFTTNENLVYYYETFYEDTRIIYKNHFLGGKFNERGLA